MFFLKYHYQSFQNRIFYFAYKKWWQTKKVKIDLLKTIFLGKLSNYIFRKLNTLSAKVQISLHDAVNCSIFGPKEIRLNKINFLLRNEDGDTSTHIIWCIFVQDLTAKYSWGFSSFLVIDIKQIDFCSREKQLRINGLIFKLSETLLWFEIVLYYIF